MNEHYELEQISACPWVNLYKIHYERKGKTGTWITCSRKERPIIDTDRADAVVIVPIWKGPSENKLVVIREFRIPIWDYEYSFPAGLIEKGHSVEETIRKELKEETGLELSAIKTISPVVFTSAGFTDENCHMALVEVQGTPCNKHLEESEDIEVHLMDVTDIRGLLASQHKISAKAWGLLYHFAILGEIRYPDKNSIG